jgi:CRP/FNR family cyclic AMP-dependent transcriptional regulator
MLGIAALTLSLPLETLKPGTHLTTEGTRSGHLYVLESGRLRVSRRGVTLASIAEPGAIVGEMAVLLGTPHSATVIAETEAKVRVMANAIEMLGQNAEFALHIATVACARLNTTSALLVEMQNQAEDQPREQALMQRLLGALSAAPMFTRNTGRIDHE